MGILVWVWVEKVDLIAFPLFQSDEFYIGRGLYFI